MSALKRLMFMNRGRGQPIAVNAVNDEATIYLYDAIVANEIEAQWFGGVAADYFVKTLASIDSPIVNIRINSPGGDVFAGRAIENAIRQSDKTIVAHIDGFAASAASYVALAADSVQIAPGGFFMIHNAWTFAMGDAYELMQTADLLDKIDESLIKTYAKETGQDPAQIAEWMKAETWFSAEEAIQYGFADAISEASPKDMAKWDLSAYKHAPNGGAVASDTKDSEAIKAEEDSKANARAKRQREIAIARLSI